MLRVRVIPVLLIKEGGLYKGVKFKNHRYVGDPINAVKIFNEKEVDEIIIIDISATANKSEPSLAMISEITSEAFMPLAYGGGVKTIEQIKQIFHAGVEKVVINTHAYNNYKLIEEAATIFGSQSITVAIDTKKNLWGKDEVYVANGSVNIQKDPVKYAKELEQAGAGEIFLQSIDRDGTYSGYDLKLLKKITAAVQLPVVVSGGASSIQDFKQAVTEAGASGVAAGSLFVFVGDTKGVLINYPTQAELKKQLTV
ncbi:MAG: hisF [Cytophagaceae bacterium]|jgi:cyclase|nr:hisF [Cytophagaceae bacterium]